MISGEGRPEDARERFERVTRALYEPLQKFARRRTTGEVVDDVVAETLLVLWRRLDEVVEGDELAWCYGVARRVLANHHRSAARARRLVDRLSSATHSASSASAAVDATGRDGDEVRTALATLSSKDRQVLMLWAWEGLEPRDIAVVLDVSPNAAAIRLHRSKQRLRRQLDRRKSWSDAGQPTVGHPEN